MSQYLEFIANHPFLVAAAAALIGIIIVYEVKQATRGYRDVEPTDATRLMNNDDATMVDVRPAAEYAKSRVLNAISVPDSELDDRIGEIQKRGEHPVIVYCANGAASGRTATRLVGAGIARVYNLKGGLSAWETAGLPVTRGRQGGKK
ncbi:MAG: rhodanese-like domain-containing protein [Xanthomonadaceae bacterium]|nr:rhodanese-like domain-containing protein [Xanthomonadaceae bacterium]